MKKLIAPITVGLAVVFLGPAAGADARGSEAGYTYEFDDELLQSDVMSGHVPVIRGPFKAKRVLLLRPRGSFVPEMLKSVEQM